MLFKVSLYVHAYICSSQSENRDNSGIVLRRVVIPTLLDIENSNSARFNSGIVRGQSGNRDKVRSW